MASASATIGMERVYNISFAILTLALIPASLWVSGSLAVVIIAWGGLLILFFLVGTALLVWLPGVRGSKAYLIFVVFPLASLVSAALFLTFIFIAISADPDRVVNERLMVIGSGLLTIAVVSSLGASVALRTVLAKRDRTPLLYITVALTALAISTVLLFLMYPLAVTFSAGYIIVLSPMLGTVLIGTLGYPGQQIVVGMLVLAALILVGGWARLGMIGDGLDAFTGQERVRAEDAMRLQGCPYSLRHGAAALRVVKDDGGEFRVLGYTWWGLPSGAESCGAYRQWNRW